VSHTGLQIPAALPVVSRTSEPTWVRHGSSATKQAYAEALAFESVLVEELSRSLTSGGAITGEENEASGGEVPGAPSQPQGFAAMTAQALSSALMSAGGLGLAAQLARSSAAGGTAGAAAFTVSGGTRA